MFKIKSTVLAVLLIVLFIMSGCSEDVISPLSENGETGKAASDADATIDSKKFHSKISLKPRQTVEFHAGNTIFRSFNSISILNCGITKSSLEILGYANDAILLLSCNSNDFFAYSITIENKTRSSIELDVFLGGILKRKSGLPVFNDKELL